MPKPFLPYGRQSIDEGDVQAVIEVLNSDYLTTGPEVPRVADALSEACGAEYAVAMSNGTAALHAAAAAAGLGPGDEAIVPAITFAASANCARYMGAKPVFVDVDPESGLIDVDLIEAAITPNTRAIIPVHLTGRPADLDAIAEIARGNDLCVIEDAAHALGSTLGDERIGSCQRSDMAIFSFHPVKTVTTAEGGAVTRRNPTLDMRLRQFRDHGMERRPEHFERANPGPWYHEQQALGFNYRLSAIHCALGTSQMARLPQFAARRKALAARYDALLDGHEKVRPIAKGVEGAESGFHLYCVLIDYEALGTTRATVMGDLRALGIGTQVHYIPVPMHPYYRGQGEDPSRYAGALSYYERTLSLPLFPAMADDDVDRVVTALDEVLSR